MGGRKSLSFCLQELLNCLLCSSTILKKVYKQAAEFRNDSRGARSTQRLLESLVSFWEPSKGLVAHSFHRSQGQTTVLLCFLQILELYKQAASFRKDSRGETRARRLSNSIILKGHFIKGWLVIPLIFLKNCRTVRCVFFRQSNSTSKPLSSGRTAEADLARACPRSPFRPGTL